MCGNNPFRVNENVSWLPQGCRCAPTAGLKLANAFGVNRWAEIANAFGVTAGLKLANAFGVNRWAEITERPRRIGSNFKLKVAFR